MRLSITATAVLGIALLTAAIGIAQSKSAAAQSVEGVWVGTTTVVTGAGASTNPKRQTNFHIYTKGYYTVMAQDAGVALPTRKAPPPMKTPGKPTDAEKAALYDFWAPVIAQTGTYEVKGNTITQRDLVAKGTPGERTVEFRIENGGKTLLEIAKSAPGQPVSETRRTYTRVE